MKMKKIIILIGFILLMGIIVVFSQVPGKVIRDETRSKSLYENEDYVSQIIVSIPWGEGENQIGKYEEFPFVPNQYDYERYTPSEIEQKVKSGVKRIFRGELIPHSFGVSPDGKLIYVPDFFKKRIFVFNPEGEIIQKINTLISDDDRMGATVQDIAIDKDNNIYFMGFPTLYTTHIRKIDPVGKKIFEIDVPHNILGENIRISENILFYGNRKKAIVGLDINTGKKLEQPFDGIETNSYFIDAENWTLQDREKSKILTNIYLDNMEPDQILGEDRYGNLYIQYGDYTLNATPEGTFCIRKFNKAGKVIAQVDLKKIYNRELVGRSNYTRITNIDNDGNIYQLYVDFDDGVQIIRYSSEE